MGLLGRYDATAARLDPASELRVWESVQAEHLANGGHAEWHIAKNDTVVKDTRIPPAGFHPITAAAIAMTAAVGADFGPPDAIRNHDDVAVRFGGLAPLPEGPVQVTARVFYQSTTREFVEALAAANTTDDRGVRLREILGEDRARGAAADRHRQQRASRGGDARRWRRRGKSRRRKHMERRRNRGAAAASRGMAGAGWLPSCWRWHSHVCEGGG